MPFWLSSCLHWWEQSLSLMFPGEIDDFDNYFLFPIFHHLLSALTGVTGSHIIKTPNYDLGKSYKNPTSPSIISAFLLNLLSKFWMSECWNESIYLFDCDSTDDGSLVYSYKWNPPPSWIITMILENKYISS